MYPSQPRPLVSAALVLMAACLLSACGGGGGDAGGTGPQAGDVEYTLNPEFGGSGVVTGQGSQTHTRYMRADVLASGTMALLGTTQNVGGTFGWIMIEKRAANGALIAAFGGTGRVEVAGSPGFTPKAVHLDAQNGSVVTLSDRGLAGYTLHKFLANGNPDPAFGVGGTKDVSTANSFKAAGMVVEADGSIVVAGYTSAMGYLMRYVISGAPDPTWNGGAPYTFQLFGDGTYILDIAPRIGGGYLVTGRRDIVGPPDWIFVGRFNTSGLPVPGFGSAGFLLYHPGWQPHVRGIVAQPGGASVVYGTKGSSTAFALGVDSQGDVPASFGLRELAAPQVPGVIRATTLQSDGSTTIGLRTPGSHDVTLWRLLGDGTEDSDFGTGGLSLFPVDPDAIIDHLEPHPGGGFLALGHILVQGHTEGYVMHLVAQAQ